MKSILTTVAAAAFLVASPAPADPNHGAYLAAKAAARAYDFDEAAYWYGVALRSDPTNPHLIDNTLASMVGAGDTLGAVTIARIAADGGLQSQIANLILDADAARRGDWEAIFAAHEAGREVSPLADGLTRAWGYVGLGNMERALMAFDEVIETPGMRPFGLYHKAVALAHVGDFEGAATILTLPAAEGGLAPTVRGLIVLAQAMSQMGQGAEAVALIDEAFGPTPDPTVAALRAALAGGAPVPFDIVGSASDGVAEIYYSIASVLGDETPAEYTLLYARQAQALKPGDADIAILIADLLEGLGNYELAAAAYASVPQSDPAYYDAEIGRSDVLLASGDTELQIEVLRNLVRAFPDRPVGQIYLGNALRRQELYPEARDVFTTALGLMDAADSRRWYVYYMRAVSHFHSDDWPAAEADFRAALDLNPDQPQVLNYLGYSLVERREKLDEALGMIERAVEARPDNGNIVDSLGWALFVLGRVEEAVAPMERAVELSPMDPIINDHLGDVYWSVGRYLEAQFQWNRALSLDPEPDLAADIRLKLEGGLDAVAGRDEAAAAEVSTAQDL